jgi:site-specific DNA-cytosine methylase
MFGAALLPAVTVGEALGIDAANRRIRGSGVVRRDHPSDEPCPTVMQPTGGKSGLMVVGGGTNPHFAGEDRTERDITGEPSTTIAAQHTHNALPTIHEYRWSDAMLEKHPASPAPTVQSKWFKGGAEGLVQVEVDPKHPVQRAETPASTLTSGGTGHGPTENSIKLSVDGRTWDSRHPIPGPDEPMPTVRPRSPRDGGRCTEQVIREKHLVRRLTPTECARLQSMPDDFRWPDGITKTAQYKIIGNGWACALAAHLSEALTAADPESRTVIDLFSGGGLGAVGWHGRFWALNFQGA